MDKKVRKVAFRLRKKCGDHNEEGVNYVAGDIVKSTRNLEKMFKNKFDRVRPKDDFDFEETSPNIPSPQKTSKKYKNSNKFGTNVTPSFPTAIAAELVVYEKDAWYQVVDRNTEGGKPELVSKKKLREKDVEDFLKNYVEPDSDDDDDDGDDEDE